MLRKYLNIILLVFALGLTTSCAEDPEKVKGSDDEPACMPVQEVLDPAQNDKFTRITIPDVDYTNGEVTEKGIMEWITDRITTVLVDATRKIYEEISEDDEYRTILGLLMSLTLMFYALSIMMGIVQTNGFSVVMFLVKILFIYNFAVNWDLFNKYVIEIFEAFVNDTVSFAAGSFHDYKAIETGSSSGIPGLPNSDPSMFQEMDKMTSMLWDFRMSKIILSLMLTGVTGFFWGLMLLAFMLLYLMAIITAVKVYLFALIARHVLYALGPIFLTFALFNQTKSLFDGYIEQLINFSLQPVLLFIFMGLFHSVLVGFIGNLYLDDLVDTSRYTDGDTVSEEDKPCIQYIPLTNFMGQQLYFYKLCMDGKNNCPEFTDLKAPIPIDIWVLISAVICCYLMFSMTGWVVQVAGRLSSGYISLSDVPIQGFSKLQSSLGQGVSKIFKGGK